MTKFLAIASGKGGVGKTTVSINLANALAKFDADVTVVDGDLINPNVSLYLGHDKVGPNLHSVMKGQHSINETIYSHPCGIKVVPASISLSDLQYSDYKRFGEIVSKLKGDVVVIDTHPGINEDAQEIFKIADEILVVTSPDLTALTDAMKTIRIAEALGSSVIGVVLNRVEGKNYEMKQDDIESFLDKPVVAKIPEDKNIKKAVMDNYPAYHLYPKSSASIEFTKLAAQLIGQEVESEGFFSDILKILGIK